jgi:hypothetical protein
MNAGREETWITPKVRRELAKLAFWGTVIAALIGAAGSGVAAWITILPRLPVQEHVYHTQVSASTHPFASTGITVEKGDEIWILVQGEDAYWNCGWDPVGPEGHFNSKNPGFYSPSADFCELIGHVQHTGVRFRVGMYERFITPSSGLLYLGANDDPGTNTSNEPYYADNTGHLSVEVIIRR